MKIKILLCTLIISQTLFCQDFRFGKVSKEELMEKKHPLDPTADAAILYREITTSIEYSKHDGFYVSTEVFERIKLYNENGFDWANKKIKLYRNNNLDDKLYGLKATTYYLGANDKIEEVKLRDKGIFEKEISEFLKIKKFTMPQIQTGCVIEYKYTVDSPFISNIDTYQLQDEIPIKRVKIHFDSPEYLQYKYHQKGWVPFRVKTHTGSEKIVLSYSRDNTSKIDFLTSIYEVDLKNVPALKKEAYSGNLKNYTASLKFELSYTQFPNSLVKTYTTTWEDVCQHIFESDNFGDQLKINNYFDDDIDKLLVENTDPHKKMIAIYEFAKQKMTWNSYLGYYSKEGVRTAYKNGSGNAGDINLMLIAMLRYAGLEANPILVSTKNNGIPLFPTRNGFNYLIAGVEINDAVILLDATNKIGVPNILKPGIINWKGRMIHRDGSSKWISLMPKSHASHTAMVSVNLLPNAAISGKSQNRFTGHYAMSHRKNYKNLAQDEIRKKLENEKEQTKISEIKFENLDQPYKPVELSYNFESLTGIEKIGNKLYFSPMLFMAMKENPFKLEERKYPIDYSYPMNDKYIININIPEGYAIASLPKDVFFTMANNIVSFKYLINQSGENIQLSVAFSINQPFILATEYDALKNFYEQLIKKEKEKVVFVKI